VTESKANLPATVSGGNGREVFALSTEPSSIANALGQLSTGLQKAVSEMRADDISLEVDVESARLRSRLRAYKHRDNGGR
jgi:hypothetical protein